MRGQDEMTKFTCTPPSLPPGNVARLPRYTGTSSPPATARYALAPPLPAGCERNGGQFEREASHEC